MMLILTRTPPALDRRIAENTGSDPTLFALLRH